MNVGDLVRFAPDRSMGTTLTAIKYFERVHRRIGGSVGIIIWIDSTSAFVAFNNDMIVLHVSYLKLIAGGDNAS